MSVFQKAFELITGRRVEEPKMGVQYDGRSSLDELKALARMTASAIRPEIKYGPPGERLNVITTGDFDSKGKLKDSARKRIDDFEKTRKGRK